MSVGDLGGGVGSESMTGCKKSGFDFGVVSAELQQH